MRTLFYVGLEPLQSRYTHQLTEWNERAFQKRGIDYCIVDGQTLDNDGQIHVGQVLDAYGRPYYALSQMMELVKLMRDGAITGKDVIFFEDMFTPGIESLAYILNQISEKDRPLLYIRCLAQSIDPDDFVHVWGMNKWMGHYEKMVDAMPNVNILATSEEMVANMKIAGWTAPIYNISGLAFGKEEVRSRVETIPFYERPHRVVFSSRWDMEKQPDFYMDVIEKVKEMGLKMEFCLLSGKGLVSNDQHLVNRARALESKGLLTIYENLSKNDYYKILANSRVLVNTALQDWVSNTVSEADALGTNVLFPAYRSFPETFSNDYMRLYVPWSLDDCINKLFKLVNEPHPKIGEISDWNDKTIDRYVDIMLGIGEEWNRTDSNYRAHLRQPKY